MSQNVTGGARTYLLFVFGPMMSGEPDHARLSGAEAIGPATTEAGFDLVDLGTSAGLVAGGSTAVRGEVYRLSPAQLAAVDVHHGHPVLSRRSTIRLDDGREVEAHQLEPEQTRGRRRIRSGDWKTRLAPSTPSRDDKVWSRWAKQRR